MKQSLKKVIAKYEARIGTENVHPGAIVIYNPEFSNFDRKIIKAKYVIAIPDNGMDQNLTEKIGEKFVVL